MPVASMRTEVSRRLGIVRHDRPTRRAVSLARRREIQAACYRRASCSTLAAGSSGRASRPDKHHTSAPIAGGHGSRSYREAAFGVALRVRQGIRSQPRSRQISNN
jgi:hypothetical protein